MATFDRRDFLRFGSLSLLAGNLSTLLAAPLRAGAPSNAAPAGGDRKLMILFLRGGNDGVNTVIPVGDTTYQAARQQSYGDVWIDPNTTIPIPGTSYAALHPSLARLSGAMTAQHVAFLHAIGSEQPSRSHFVEMQKAETAEELAIGLAEEGFVARLIERAGFTSPVRAVSIGRSQQRLFATKNVSRASVTCRQMSSYSLGSLPPYVRLRGAAPTPLDPEGDALAGGFAFPYPNDVLDSVVRATGDLMLKSEVEVGNARSWLYGGNHQPAKYPTSALEAATHHPGSAAINSPSCWNLMRELEEGMALLRQTACRVVGVDMGGFDTHGGQIATQQALFEVLGLGLESMYVDSINDPTMDLLILVVTEFGRTNRVNGSSGTDHGVGTAYIAIGPGVNAGVYNCAATASTQFGAAWVPLTNANAAPYENAVPTATHVQTVIAEICRKHFLLSPADTDIVVPGFSAKTGPAYQMLNFLV